MNKMISLCEAQSFSISPTVHHNYNSMYKLSGIGCSNHKNHNKFKCRCFTLLHNAKLLSAVDFQTT